jgi:nitrite reductase (NADH) large subunit
MNTAVHLLQDINSEQIAESPIVIVGTGPVGIKALTTLIMNNPAECIIVYGAEPWEPYNRVKLSSFVAGDVSLQDITESQRLPVQDNLVHHHNCRIVSIDRENHSVTDETGRTQKYRKLILAVGSEPHVPAIEGSELESVYTFRNMTDAHHLMARQVKSRTVVVVGGGVLGLEAAKAMSRNKTQVVVIDHASHLMSNQLDEQAADLLREHILSLGIKVHLSSGIKKIIGDSRVESVELRDGKRISCDTVIFSTGIKPNIDLARNSKLSVGRGIRVSDSMQTNDPDIYAIGECAEHRGIVYGLVAPGFEQAKVAIADINRKKTSYTGSISSTQLKVVNVPVFSMGHTGEGESKSIFNEYVYEKPSTGIYRKIIIFKNRLVGAMSVGTWESCHRVQECITKNRIIWPWQLKRFMKSGDLWDLEEAGSVTNWPASTIVCNCMNVSRGQCSKAIVAGCQTIEEIMRSTSASTVCGSCRPLIGELLGSCVKAEKIKALKSFLFYSSIASIAIVLAFLLPGMSYNNSAEEPLQWDVLWREGILKQVSGFSILALTIIALLVSLRKRWKRFRLVEFSVWRYLHVLIGLFVVLALFVHTGFRAGENLNGWLMMLFSSLMLVGGIYGVFMAFQHMLDGALAQKIKSYFNWVHLLLFWPVPVLLSFHVFKVYYF